MQHGSYPQTSECLHQLPRLLPCSFASTCTWRLSRRVSSPSVLLSVVRELSCGSGGTMMECAYKRLLPNSLLGKVVLKGRRKK